MATPATSIGSNNLHGTLRFISKKYCPKSSGKSNQKLLLVKRARRGLPSIRKSWTARSDRLQVVSIVTNSDSDNETKTSNEEGDKPTNSASEAVAGKGPLAPEAKTAEPSAATTAVATTNASTGATSNTSDKPAKKDTIQSTTTTTKLLHPEDLAHYKEAEAAQKQALIRIEMARQKVHSDQIQQVWGVYKYGLKHVLALNDLSNAPDAILPGNF
eukprot:CAMPEP_0116149436 /NCGR_PEP_ID=MMETSP0329-20121206/18948_1 /TAXON_ID=697910 /ORGANISM="Pseudo-nitzschia arenysensis, Strain B593" /LENGTH=214 /DNA_ID=CAMNT_0003645753 /DNA_START=23 /DNA_END=667 /DNA_ORIENTATION=+